MPDEPTDISDHMAQHADELIDPDEFWRVAQESRQCLLQRSDQARLLDLEDHVLSIGRLLHEPVRPGFRFFCSDVQDDPDLVTSGACKLRVTTDVGEQVFELKSLEAILCDKCLPSYHLKVGPS